MAFPVPGRGRPLPRPPERRRVRRDTALARKVAPIRAAQMRGAFRPGPQHYGHSRIQKEIGVLDFTEQERAVLRLVQADLPDSLTPYADIAAQAGCSEEEVITLLHRLRECGAIRRFGASIKHQRTGWNHNAMVAWIVPRDDSAVERCGTAAATHPNVSHCYYRPSGAPDWPYELYTMVHGRSAEECERVVAELEAMIGLRDHAALSSIRELKKISPTYF